jgi:hypothetical protein
MFSWLSCNRSDYHVTKTIDTEIQIHQGTKIKEESQVEKRGAREGPNGFQQPKSLTSLRLTISPTSNLLKCTRQFRFQIVFASKGTFSARGLTMSFQRLVEKTLRDKGSLKRH